MSKNYQQDHPNHYQQHRGIPQSLMQNQKHHQSKIGPDYVCRRCEQKGHYIKDCPTNLDPTYDPHQGKGVPKSQLWKRDLGISTKEFLENKQQIYNQILKEGQIYKECQIDQTNKVQAYMNDQVQYTIPPSLACQLCENLMIEACMTKCCGSSCCLQCLQRYLQEKQKYQCPFCYQGDQMVEEIVPNIQLRMIIDWFKRQRMIQEKEEKDIKFSKEQNKRQKVVTIDKIIQLMLERDQDLNNIDNNDDSEHQNKNTNNLKFNPLIHSGTRYDQQLGRRVPVSDVNDLPKIAPSNQTIDKHNDNSQSHHFKVQHTQVNPEISIKVSQEKQRSRSRERKN